MNMLDDLKTEALNLGFFSAGITPVEPVPEYSYFLDWLAHSHHAGMMYLANDYNIRARKYPGLLMPGCKTVISLAMEYSPPEPIVGNLWERQRGYIAAYARQIDYHIPIKNKLARLAESLRKVFDKEFSWRAYSDNAPILERSYAQAAGLGWIGKNSCLINPGVGSFFFLGEILIDIEIASERMEVIDRCGNCRRCVDVCPTKSILPGRIIDSSSCISYLTIENKGQIPEGLRSLLGNNIFGCDLCQTICPWNQKTIRGKQYDQAKTVPILEYPLLLEAIKLTADEFYQKYYNTPLLRAKYRGFLRNVVVALGNSRNPMAIDRLKWLMDNTHDAMIISHLGPALQQLETEY
jgi:epoxyqueuosine reductase